jgi:hypothetical protein
MGAPAHIQPKPASRTASGNPIDDLLSVRR